MTDEDFKAYQAERLARAKRVEPSRTLYQGMPYTKHEATDIRATFERLSKPQPINVKSLPKRNFK